MGLGEMGGDHPGSTIPEINISNADTIIVANYLQINGADIWQ